MDLKKVMWLLDPRTSGRQVCHIHCVWRFMNVRVNFWLSNLLGLRVPQEVIGLWGCHWWVRSWMSSWEVGYSWRKSVTKVMFIKVIPFPCVSFWALLLHTVSWLPWSKQWFSTIPFDIFAVEPADYWLKSLKLWAEINVSSFELCTSNTCYGALTMIARHARQWLVWMPSATSLYPSKSWTLSDNFLLFFYYLYGGV